ncbi:MAG: inositol monophosphatase [Planctomycetaceae bacterium]|nr:inositol monophosphatase [Planctomycetaceae bacterium]
MERLDILLTGVAEQYSPRLLAAVRFAVEAGQQTLERFCQQDLLVEKKNDRSPVTAADKNAELLLRARIQGAFPDDAIVGEEFENVAGTSEYRWIIDPIDGTKSFICGVPLYATLVGVECGDESRIGVIYIPALEELIFAEVGFGSGYLQGDGDLIVPRVSSTTSLAESCFVTSQVSTYYEVDRAPQYLALEKEAYITRTWGDAYGYLLVATGRAEVMVDAVMNVWDAAAILPVMIETGGTFTDWNGKATIHGGEGIGTNGLVLEQVLAAIKV